MAKEKAKAEKVVEKAAKDEAPEFKFGVNDIAEKLDIGAASVRVKLRNAGIEKAGKSYGWNTKTELNEVIDSLKEEKAPAKTDKKAEKAAAKEAAEKAAEKAAKKAGKKKKADPDD